jgi:hypothetical protein
MNDNLTAAAETLEQRHDIADILSRLRALLGESHEAAFKAGWRHGYYDGGEHDCRMFTPTAERAYADYLSERSSSPSSEGLMARLAKTLEDFEDYSYGNLEESPYDEMGKLLREAFDALTAAAQREKSLQQQLSTVRAALQRIADNRDICISYEYDATPTAQEVAREALAAVPQND